MNSSPDYNPEALVLQIIRMSTEDGPGIRTTVFFKGCTLGCAWCHNPESISPKTQVCWIGNRCIGCRTCLDVCPEKVLSMTPEGIVIDRTRCRGCGTCADACPGTALERLGTKWRLDDLVAEVLKDRAYFDASGGGITVSGGEPTMQPEFAAAFLKSLKEKGVHTALDTCGQCGKDALDAILPHAAMILYDLKLFDPETHRRFTGHANERILDNLVHVAGAIRARIPRATLWIRTPIIPGATDSPENIGRIGKFISSLPGAVSRWELCAFNNLCRDKYRRLDREWMFADAGLLTEGAMNGLAEAARNSGVDPGIVCWSGATKHIN